MSLPTRELRAYKKYVIEADPQKLPSKEWSTYIVIRRDRPGGPKLRPFEDEETSPTRISAIRHCFDFGKRIIDGEIEGLTVEDL